MNNNVISRWLRDPRYAPVPPAEPDAPRFLSVEMLGRPMHDNSGTAAGPEPAAGRIEIDTLSGQRLRISGAYDPEALAG